MKATGRSRIGISCAALYRNRSVATIHHNITNVGLFCTTTTKRDFKMNDEQFLKIFATHSPYKRHKVGVMP